MKHIQLARTAPFLAALLFAFALAIPQPVLAQDAAQSAAHVISPSDLQQSATNASQSRLQNQRTLQQFFSMPQAREALAKAHIDPQQVKTAVNGLSDQEMAQLAARARKAQSDFAGGLLGTSGLLLILLAIAIIILLVVVA